MRACVLAVAFTALFFPSLAQAASKATEIPIYIAPPDDPTDLALARWAFDSWQRAAGNGITFVRVPEKQALLRMYWTGNGKPGGFGEMTPIDAGGRLGAAVYVNTEMELLGSDIAGRAARDRLYRDTIVYLTCVHELGHALGLQHTAAFADIMYSFQYGGDIPGYFARYRDRLKARADIAVTDSFSDGDLAQVKTLHFRGK